MPGLQAVIHGFDLATATILVLFFFCIGVLQDGGLPNKMNGRIIENSAGIVQSLTWGISGFELFRAHKWSYYCL